MSIDGIYANVACADLDRSERWYRSLFGREPDARPMEGLCEWHWGAHGFQLHQDAAKAGYGTLTVRAQGLASEHERLSELSPGPIEDADHFSIVRLTDPDGNLVVLAGSH